MKTICLIFVNTKQIDSPEQFHSLHEEKQYSILSHKLNDLNFLKSCSLITEKSLLATDEV